MYCRNCGKEILETNAFCEGCGCSVETDLKVKRRTALNVKSVAVILGVIAAVALMFMVLKPKGVNASPENVAIAVVTSEYEADIDLMVKCFPDFTIRAIALDYDLPSNASLGDVKRELEEAYRYSETYTVSDARAEVVDIYSIDENNFFKGLYDDMTDDEYEEITELAEVEVTFCVDGEMEDTQLTCIKMKGKWYLLREKW